MVIAIGIGDSEFAAGYRWSPCIGVIVVGRGEMSSRRGGGHYSIILYQLTILPDTIYDLLVRMQQVGLICIQEENITWIHQHSWGL